MSAAHAQLHAASSITTPADRYCHDDLVRIVGDAINGQAMNDCGLRLAGHTDLSTDLLLRGQDILELFETLEGQLGIQLWPALALDLVMEGPTIGRLACLLAECLAGQDRAARRLTENEMEQHHG
jgi:hypothetical protein